MKKKKIIVFGMGEHGRVCESIIKDYRLFSWLGFVDDGHPDKCLGSLKDLPKLRRKYGNFGVFVAVGKNPLREKLIRKVKRMGFPLLSIIHPTSVIAGSVKIGENVFVGPRAIIVNSSVIEDGAHIQGGCILEHDNIIGECSHIISGSATGGGVKIGKRVFVGTGSIINDHLEIGDDVFIASGSVVTKSLKKGAIVAGIPAKAIKVHLSELKRYR